MSLDDGEFRATAAPTAGVRLPLSGLRDLFIALFFYPYAVILSTRIRTRLLWSVSIFIIAALISGGILGAVDTRVMARDAVSLAEWFGTETEGIGLRNGVLQWRKPAELPYTTRRNGYRFDFVGPDQPFSKTVAGSAEMRGFWISPTRVTFWFNVEDIGLGALVMQREEGLWCRTILDTTQKDAAAGLAAQMEPEKEYDKDELVALMRSALVVIVPAVLVMRAILAVVAIGMTVLVFTVVPVILRSPLAGGGIAVGLATNCCLALPPLLVATVYSAIRPGSTDFQVIFMLAFFAYGFWAMMRVRKVLAGG